MADRLSHELRTPIAVVGSSLDNLRTRDIPPDAQVYIARAEEGVRRLNAVLTRMSEATRLEQTLRTTERERFDLGRVVSGCVAGYTAAFPLARFELRLPERRVEIDGSPDLVARSSSTSWSTTRATSRRRASRSRSRSTRMAPRPGCRSRTSARRCPRRWPTGCSIDGLGPGAGREDGWAGEAAR